MGFVGAPLPGVTAGQKRERTCSRTKRWLVPSAMAKGDGGVRFGSYSGVADAGLTTRETLDGVAPARNIIRVTCNLPLGLVLAELSGEVYVAAVKPGGNLDKLGSRVRVGDRVLGTSATFGNSTWPALSLERVLTALKTRFGGEVSLILERSGLTDDIYGEKADGLDIDSNVSLDTDQLELEAQVRDMLQNFGELRNAGLPSIKTLAALLVRSAVLLKQYGRKKDYSSSVDNLYSQLKRANVPLDPKFFNLAMSAYISTGNPKSAVTLFKDIPAPNAECYTTLMKAYNKLGLMKEMIETKKAMEKCGLRLSERTYNTLLSAYSSRGRLDRVEGLFAEMRARHLMPDTVSWNVRLNAHAKGKSGGERLGRVFSLFKQMKEYNVAPSKITFTTLLGACVSSGDIARAESVLEEMREADVKPDTFTYNKLIEGYGDRLLFENALRVLTTLEQHEELSPDEYSYGLAIRACCTAGQVEIADGLLQKMKEKGFKLKPQILVTLLSAYAKKGDSTKAFLTLKEMQKANMKPGLRVMSALMHACVEAGDGDLALSVYRKMLQMHLVPDVVTFTSAVRAYGKRKEPDMAMTVFETMKNKGVEPNVTTYNALIETAMESNLPDLALEILKEMNGKESVSINGKTYNLLCNPSRFADSHTDYLKFLLQIVDTLQKADKYANGQLYCEVLQTSIRAADYDEGQRAVSAKADGLYKLSARYRPIALDAENKIGSLVRQRTRQVVTKRSR